MNSLIKLNSKILILNKKLVLTAIFFAAIRLIIMLNFLPFMVQNIIKSFENANEVLIKSLELSVSFLILLTSNMSVSAFYLGIDRYFLNLSQNENASLKDVFYYCSFKRVFAASWFCVRLLSLKLSILLLCQLPSILILSIIFFKLSTTISFAVLAVLSVSLIALIISGAVFYKLISSSLFLVKYYYISEKYLSLRNALISSQLATQNNKTAAFLMFCSFTPWFLSCFFIVPIIYVWSYYHQSKAELAKVIMRQQSV